MVYKITAAIMAIITLGCFLSGTYNTIIGVRKSDIVQTDKGGMRFLIGIISFSLMLLL